MGGTLSALVRINRHVGRRWNQRNLFPRNMLDMCNVMILSHNNEICLLHIGCGHEVLEVSIKCVEKGSTGSTL